MSKNDRIEEMDRAARAMGLATVTELAGADEKSQRFQRDMEALERNVHTLPPLGGREEIKDPLADDPTYIAVHGPQTAPYVVELAQRHREWEDLARRAAFADEPPSEMATRHDQPSTEEQQALADRLWTGFRTQHPDLTKDTAAVEAAAATVIERDGFTDEATLIASVAAELGNDGRSEGLIAPGAPRRGRQAETQHEDFVDQIQKQQRDMGLF